MALIFPRWTNWTPLALGVGLPLLLGGIVFAFWYWGSPRFTFVGYSPKQPVPYSHKLHVNDLGMDCRYCHSTVEQAAWAAVPPTKTCMNCHALVLRDSFRLEPVRASFGSDRPVEWVKVHALPDFAYFAHNVHLAAGVGCATCHGRVDHMRVVSIQTPLAMGWCLECHRNPGPNLRPRNEITNMGWDRRKVGYDPDRDASRTRRVQPPVHCSGCHR